MINMFSDITKVSVSPFGSMFAVGNTDLLDPKYSSVRFSVAGSRTISFDSGNWLRSQIAMLSSEHIIVSGLAFGADTIAHQSAIKHDIPQIAVLPSGINNITPYSNLNLAHDIVDAGGCLISAYHPKAKACRNSYIARNQIIAYLGHMLIVPEFSVHSGTRHTVDFTKDYKKYIIVNNCDYSGNQFIINNNSYNTIIK